MKVSELATPALVVGGPTMEQNLATMRRRDPELRCVRT